MRDPRSYSATIPLLLAAALVALLLVALFVPIFDCALHYTHWCVCQDTYKVTPLERWKQRQEIGEMIRAIKEMDLQPKTAADDLRPIQFDLTPPPDAKRIEGR